MKRKVREALFKQVAIDIANSEDINVWDRMEDYYLNRWYIRLSHFFGMLHPHEIEYRKYSEWAKSQSHQQAKLDSWFIDRQMDSLEYRYPKMVARHVCRLLSPHKLKAGYYDPDSLPEPCAPTVTYREPVECAEVPLWYQIYLNRGLII